MPLKPLTDRIVECFEPTETPDVLVIALMSVAVNVCKYGAKASRSKAAQVMRLASEAAVSAAYPE